MDSGGVEYAAERDTNFSEPAVKAQNTDFLWSNLYKANSSSWLWETSSKQLKGIPGEVLGDVLKSG